MDNNQNQNQNLKTNPKPLNPVGSVHKEHGPAIPSESYYIEKKHTPELSKELEESGVKVRHEEIRVDQELQNVGVSPTGTSTQVPTQPTIVLPIADSQVQQGLHASLLSSIRWLSEWCVFQLKRAHLTLKVIGGKVIRVPYRK